MACLAKLSRRGRDIMTSWFVANQALIQLMLTTAVGAMSYQIALRSGFLAFVSAGFWGIGAYGAGDIAIRSSLPWIASVAIVVAASGVGGLILSLALFRLKGQ